MLYFCECKDINYFKLLITVEYNSFLMMEHLALPNQIAM
jgi:hypothetical protein